MLRQLVVKKGDKRSETPDLMIKTFTAVIEKDSDTKLYVGYIPGLKGVHSQGETLDELQENLREVVEMLLEDPDFVVSTEFVGIQQVVIESV